MNKMIKYMTKNGKSFTEIMETDIHFLTEIMSEKAKVITPDDKGKSLMAAFGG